MFFVGDNSVGKTSVLEAIQLLCASNKYNLVQIARQREKNRAGLRVGLVDSICYLFDINSENNKCLEIHFSVAGNTKETMKEGDTFYGQIECSFSKYE